MFAFWIVNKCDKSHRQFYTIAKEVLLTTHKGRVCLCVGLIQDSTSGEKRHELCGHNHRVVSCHVDEAQKRWAASHWDTHTILYTQFPCLVCCIGCSLPLGTSQWFAGTWTTQSRWYVTCRTCINLLCNCQIFGLNNNHTPQQLMWGLLSVYTRQTTLLVSAMHSLTLVSKVFEL